LTAEKGYGKLDKRRDDMPYKSGDDKRKHDRDYIRQKRGTTERDDIIGTTDRRVLHLAEALITPPKKAQLILLSDVLNKKVTRMEGKRVNLNSMVRYGISGFTFDKIKELL